ncbi:MAG: peptidoglycan DD-metalloendopeptidase family protein [Bacteroidales bacterium]
MSRLLFTLLLAIPFIAPSYAQRTPEKEMLPPLTIPPYLSGSFGELRGGHFHSGVDIKTQGRTGLPIQAPADGYVSRINISSGGYGKALYINHPNGTTTVYGHLKSFAPEIARWVKQQQYKKQQFEVNLFPRASQFPVKRGEIIGTSGNSGSSMGPHLHYEVRNAANQKPVNPMFYNVKVRDDIAPRFTTLAVYPMTPESRVNKKNTPLYKNTRTNGTPRHFRIADADTLHIRGSAAFGVEIYDYLNGTHNRCGLRSLSVTIDNKTIYRSIMDRFSFAETRYINSHIDYAAKVEQNKQIQRTYIQPNNKLSIYDYHLNRGIFRFHEPKTYEVTLTADDFEGNTSTLTFFVKGGKEAPLQASERSPKIRFDYKKEVNQFTAPGFEIRVPGNALYDTLHFRYAIHKQLTANLLTPLYQIHKATTPLHKHFEAGIEVPQIAPDLTEKIVAVKLDKEGEKEAFTGEVKENRFLFQSRSFGTYALAIDTVPPVLKPEFTTPLHRNKSAISFIMEDELSGINSFDGFIDGQWVLFEYDAKNDRITHYLDDSRIKRGQEHELELIIIDNTNNTTTYYTTFKW